MTGQIAHAVERTASRFVRTWGFSAVEMVAARFRMTERAPAPRSTLARRALAALPDIAWLDPGLEWFSLLDHPSSMRAAIEKIVATVGAVEPVELEQALGKGHSFCGAPPAVVHAYVVALSRRVTPFGAGRRGPWLDPEEHVVLDALERAGGHADLRKLRQTTTGRLAPALLTRVLNASPLFLREARGSYRVVGAFPSASAPTLVPSLSWEARL
jgi:hypothetical protein